MGDAAGRPERNGKKKDFSCSDRKVSFCLLSLMFEFAFNIGIQFKTPEEFFLGQEPDQFDWGTTVDPRKIPTEGDIVQGGISSIAKQHQEMVVLVGFPAAGIYSCQCSKSVRKKHLFQEVLGSQRLCAC